MQKIELFTLGLPRKNARCREITTISKLRVCSVNMVQLWCAPNLEKFNHMNLLTIV
jgi:hypothetical protein